MSLNAHPRYLFSQQNPGWGGDGGGRNEGGGGRGGGELPKIRQNLEEKVIYSNLHIAKCGNLHGSIIEAHMCMCTKYSNHYIMEVCNEKCTQDTFFIHYTYHNRPGQTTKTSQFTVQCIGMESVCAIINLRHFPKLYPFAGKQKSQEISEPQCLDPNLQS